jgi:hypothetical protein
MGEDKRDAEKRRVKTQRDAETRKLLSVPLRSSAFLCVPLQTFV